MLINGQDVVGPTAKMVVLQTGAIEQRSKHFFGFEKFSRDCTRCARMTAIIGVNFANCFGDFGKFAKTEKPALLVVDFCEAGFLRDDGAPGGQIAGTAITEPAGV